MNKPITIHDIAREAGVSASTVSRVLSGKLPVAAQTRATVLEVVQRRKFRLNTVARGLSQGTTGAVGILTQAIVSSFHNEILSGIEQGLRGSAYHPIVVSGNRHRREEIAAIETLLGRRVDAIIILGSSIPDEYLRQLAEEIPVLLIGRTIQGIEDRCLHIDDEAGAYHATHYLLGLGHRRIVHLSGDLTFQDAERRRAGYVRALQDAGLQIQSELLIDGDFTERSGLLATQSLLSRGTLFSAIFAGNDNMAMGARLALFRRGVRVPEDVSIVGFDDSLTSLYTIPPLTTMRQPTERMGLAAAQAVLRVIAQHPPNLPTFAAELVIRESAALLR